MPASTPWFLRARLRTRQLMLLTAIGDEANIHRAAEVLDISQPAASKLLKDLEDLLGLSLFERLPRGMRPTWYGQILIRHARMALASMARAGSEIELLKSGRFGEVSVGAITGPALTLMPKAMALITREHGDLRVQLMVESSDVLLERMRQNKLDIMIGRLFETDDKSTLSYERLAIEPVCAIARPRHPLSGAATLSLRELEDESWILPPPGSVLRHRFELMFKEAGLDVPARRIETSSIMFITKMLQESEFIAVVPTEVARYYASYGMVTILPIELSCTMDAFGIILRKNWLLSPAAKAVLSAVKTAAASVYPLRPPSRLRLAQQQH